jgi:hypothetical protein
LCQNRAALPTVGQRTGEPMPQPQLFVAGSCPAQPTIPSFAQIITLCI